MDSDWYTSIINPQFLLWAVSTICLTGILAAFEPPPGKTSILALAILSSIASIFLSVAIVNLTTILGMGMIQMLVIPVAGLAVLGIAVIVGKRLRKD